jgi:hypothetical protein
MPRRRAPVSYRVAQRLARTVERDLLKRVGAAIDSALARSVRDLTALLNRLPGSTPDARLAALQRSIDVLMQSRNLLIQQIERAALAGRRTSFADVLAVWQEASKQAATAVGLPHAALGAVLNPRTTMLAAYENVGGARLFRTLIARAADDGFRAVNDILRSAILDGKGFEQLARELRPFVQGAVEGGADGATTTAAAFRTVRFNATRIAYSEIHNARSEAEVQHFASDPLIEAVAWRLAPDRGTNRGPDACDALAENDFYGLGPGVYPVDSVPFPPHPFDRCERVPITRSVDKANDPKPSPGLQTSKVEVSRDLSAAARRNMEQMTLAALVG